MCYYLTNTPVATLAPMIRDISPIGLRVPEPLKNLIRKAAKDNGRSMNSEILTRLNASFDPHLDLSRASTGELIRELIDRNEPGRISIEITPPAKEPPQM